MLIIISEHPQRAQRHLTSSKHASVLNKMNVGLGVFHFFLDQSDFSKQEKFLDNRNLLYIQWISAEDLKDGSCDFDEGAEKDLGER